MTDSKSNAKRRKALHRWHDIEEIRWAVRNWATKIGVRSPEVHLRKMKRKWASMSTVGRLTLDSQLLRLPKELGEFVIVHELVHLLAPNHGKVFKSFMLAYMPDWEQREERLHKFTRRPRFSSGRRIQPD